MNKEVEEECLVCMEKYNNKRRCIKCNMCPSHACFDCTKTYILGLSSDAHCMQCKKEWNKEFLLSEEFPLKFINKEYKEHRENVLFDKEKALLPEAQLALEKYKEIPLLEEEEHALRARLRVISNRVIKLRRSLKDPFYVVDDEDDTKVERRQFIKTCPAEGCRGFLSQGYMCSLCETKVCSKCLEIKGKKGDTEVNHICKKENIETAKLLKSDTKPCPNCGVPIFKISGCAQMFCTVCHIAFSWLTGRIEHIIHNPHYYEWKRKTGGLDRAPGDVQCGGIPEWFSIISHLKKNKLDQHQDIKYITSAHRTIVHISRVTMQRYRDQERIGNVIIDDHNRNIDLRIKFLNQKIDEVSFKRRLQQREKKRDKHRAIYQILDMLVNTCSDILRNILTIQKVKNTKVKLSNIKKEIENLFKYAETALYAVCQNYKCKVPSISVDVDESSSDDDSTSPPPRSARQRAFDNLKSDDNDSD